MTVERGAIRAGGETIAYTVRRSARRTRTVALRLEAGEVVVVAPVRLTKATVEAFVLDRAAWILRRRAEIARAPAPSPFAARATLPYRGRELSFGAAPAAVKTVRVAFDGEAFGVAYPEGLAGEPLEAALRLNIAQWYARRAQEMLQAAVAMRAADMGLQPGPVLVRDQKTRWGSCAADGTLRFNWRLALVAPDLLDYVVVHELAHLVQRNHSAAFWAVVANVLPDHRTLRARLRDAQDRMIF